jgi:hypothetical protein
MIGAFLHSPSVVLVRQYSSRSPTRFREVVELDRKLWTCDREWYSHRAHLAGRILAWRAESPSAILLPDSAAALARMDPQSSVLCDLENLEMQRCYQIALFFWMHLNAISFNTSALIIRSNLLELQYRLSNMDMKVMSAICRTTLFNILLAGTNAARGHPERQWFVKQIVTHYSDVRNLDSLYQLLAAFFDPLCVRFSFIEETWSDIVKARMSSRSRCNNIDLYDTRMVTPVKHYRPTGYSPSLTRPTAILEVLDDEHDMVEHSLHEASATQVPNSKYRVTP